jgi:hypothetical protein
MTVGDRIRVFPVGMSDQAAVGVLVLCSKNRRSIAIGFGEWHVPFITAATGMALHPEHGKMMLLTQKDGFWCSVFDNDRRYVVEETGGKRCDDD